MRPLCFVVAVAFACGKSDPHGLPPAKDWGPQSAPMAPSSAAAPAGSGAEAREGFERCFGRELSQHPQAAHALGVLARHAPVDEVKPILTAILADAHALAPAPRAKLLGEGAWTLADVGAVAEAHAVATECAALAQDGGGGRLTCLAVLGRLGAFDEARRAAADVMQKDAVAYGASLGGHVPEARALVAEIAKDPSVGLFLRSAIHLKLLAALGDAEAVSAGLATSLDPLLDAGAVVEGAASHRDEKLMRMGIAAIASAKVDPRAIAPALIGAAGTCAAAKSKPAVDDAIARFDALPAAARTGIELGPVVVYQTLGDTAEAKRRFGAGGDAVDRAMITAGIAAASGAWGEIPARVPPDATLMADIWGRALAAKLDDATRARVLAAICEK